MNVNFIDRFAMWQNNQVEVDLDTLVNDIKLKDVFEINFDGIQSQVLEEIIKEVNFNFFIQFQ